MAIDLKHLVLFSSFMATCLTSGLPLARSLELSGGRSVSSRLRRAVNLAIDQVKEGASLHDALAPSHAAFPAFFIPVLRCGEEGGRLTEILSYLADYCRKLLPQVVTLRKTWLYPALIIGFGWVVKIVMYLAFGRLDAAWATFCNTFVSTGAIVFLIWLLLMLEPIKALCDWIKLHLPLIGETHLAASSNTFLKAFSVIYKTGGVPPAEMVARAADTIGNVVLRRDFLRARDELDLRNSFADSFARVTWLKETYKNEIEVGEETGKLDESLDKITEMSVAELEFRLTAFNELFQRLTSLTVTMSIVETVWFILLATQ